MTNHRLSSPFDDSADRPAPADRGAPSGVVTPPATDADAPAAAADPPTARDDQHDTLASARAVVASAAERLSDAERDFDSALDRGVRMQELREFDAAVTAADRVHSAARSTVRRLQQTGTTGDNGASGTPR